MDATLNELAEVIGIGGHAGCHDELRALALEALADPARAAHLLNGTLLDYGTAAGPPPGGDNGGAAGPGNAGSPDAPAGDYCRSDQTGPTATAQKTQEDESPDRATDGVGADIAGGAEQGQVTGPFGMPQQPRIGVLKLDLRLTAADLCAGASGHSPQLGEVVRSQLQALIAAAGRRCQIVCGSATGSVDRMEIDYDYDSKEGRAG